MPPERWMISIDPLEETLGDLMLRMRTQRGWYQKDVARAMGLPPERQSLLSRYENDSVVRPNPEIIEGIARVYELPLEVVTMAAHRSSQRRQSLPGPSVAIPQEPELIEAVRALFLLEPEQLPSVAQHIRMVAEGPARMRTDEKAAS